MARHKKPPPDVGFWTERDLLQAREWKRIGFSISDIANALGREVHRVQNKWDDDGFGLTVLPKNIRKCLTCTSPFESDGPHNRMCDRCREKITNASSTIGDFDS